MTESKTSVRKLTARERELEALRLRKRGNTYQTIADNLGMSVAGAYKAVVRALTKITDKTKEEADHVRLLELERLDRLFLAAYNAVLNGNLNAIDKCLNIMTRRSKYLALDAPTTFNFNWREEAEAAGIKASDVFENMVGEYAKAIKESAGSTPI